MSVVSSRPSAECSTTSPPASNWEQLQRALQPQRQAILEHPLYRRLTTPREVRIFMEHHVAAVWDFMWQLKWLQSRLTCVSWPWIPTGDPEVRRFINEIVLGEESDEFAGSYASHFEMYLAAMRQVGAQTEPMEALLEQLRAGGDLEATLRSSRLPLPAREFVEATRQALAKGQLHEVAAAFTLGRETLIPEMFRRVLQDLRSRFGEPVDGFCHYLDRHIVLDDEHHGPLAERMLERLCGSDQRLWSEAQLAATQALDARLQLWNGVVAALGCRE